MTKRLRKWLFGLLGSWLDKRGYALVQWKRHPFTDHLALPPGAAKYLVQDNPKLKATISNYSKMNPDITASPTWDWRGRDFGKDLLQSFRGDKAYVWQAKGVDVPELRYLISTYYQNQHDSMNLLEKLEDDVLFGNQLFDMGGRKISRELLDSANEINFLERTLNLSSVIDLKILDIGAGYGRLAHRSSQAFPNLKMYYCTDGVPLSSFICDYYIHFRNVMNARVLEMPVIEQELAKEKIHLAINIHSFSECSLDAITWWMQLISKLEIRYLMIVPNSVENAGSTLLTNTREDFSNIIHKHHYRLLLKEPKYADPLVQKLGLYPSHYHLFERMDLSTAR